MFGVSLVVSHVKSNSMLVCGGNVWIVCSPILFSPFKRVTFRFSFVAPLFLTVTFMLNSFPCCGCVVITCIF